MKRILFLAAVSVSIIACNNKKDYKEIFSNPLLYSNTVHELNKVVMGNSFSPIVASRNYMYAAVAGYEVMAAGYPDKFNSLAGQVHGLSSVPQPEQGKKINFELASILAYCKLGQAVTFPEGSMKEYVDSLKKLAKDHGMPSDEYDNTIAYADTVSAVLMAWSKKDNYAETRSFPKYTVMLDSPSRWVPTPPGYFEALEPNWRYIRPLVMDSSNQFLPPPPPKFDVTDKNSMYYKEVVKIKDAIDSITPDQKHMANFWDDNPLKMNVTGHVMYATKKFSPPGHWMSIAGIAAKKANFDFPNTVYAFAITAIAQFDAFIQCWDEKYRANSIRPETVINKYMDPEWRPILQTPPFPEYTCGHCTCSSANAEALTKVFGDNFAYTDTTEEEFGITSRSYKSFRDAASENIKARFYGGIHYYNSCTVSHKMGATVGDYVIDHLKMKK
ncbi:MAG: vanadium-dependent haloperoxidase [Bacteroidetes bacterium]|nr:vanadium-dependent haloperoxidase [Bacteroidota bacterium]